MLNLERIITCERMSGNSREHMIELTRDIE